MTQTNNATTKLIIQICKKNYFEGSKNTLYITLHGEQIKKKKIIKDNNQKVERLKM